MTKRPTRAERIRDACPGYDPPPMTHAEQFADLALEAEGLLRGACRMRDLYRAARADLEAERARADEALRELDEAERLLERVAGEVDDVLAGIPVYLADEIAALMRARQEQRGKGGETK